MQTSSAALVERGEAGGAAGTIEAPAPVAARAGQVPEAVPATSADGDSEAAFASTTIARST